MGHKVSLIKCTSYDKEQVYQAVKQAVDLVGGMSAFVKSGERILLKPNLLGAREPERAVTTHPEVVRAVIRLVRETGAVPILGDSPGGAIKGVERVWTKTGMKTIASEEDVELVNFETKGAYEANINHKLINSIHLSKITREVDGIINIPKLKTHGLMIYTGCIKNLYGCIPGLRKAEYHKRAPYPDVFSALLGELYLILKDKVRLNIVDGIIGMEGNGPSSGDVRKLDMIWAGKDGLSLDFAITNSLGSDPEKVATLCYLSDKLGHESYSLDNIEIKGTKLTEFSIDNFKFPKNWYLNLIPNFVVNILGRFLWMKPQIIPEICTSCLLCVKSCPVKAIKKTGPQKPRIIQEECISCLCCHELCPHKAIELKSGFLAKLLIRH